MEVASGLQGQAVWLRPGSPAVAHAAGEHPQAAAQKCP